MTWRRLGDRIRSLRERRGLTREALAVLTGLSAVYIKKIESGERLAPSMPTLARIAKALGASLHVELIERLSHPRRKH